MNDQPPYSEAAQRVIELALNDLASTWDAKTISALRELAARGALDDVDAVEQILIAAAEAHAD
jgi:hypothetical protein